MGTYQVTDVIPFDAMEPVLDAETMKLHQTKHFTGYTVKMNAALDTLAEQDPELADNDIYTILSRVSEIDDYDLRTTLVNNGGGYVNHHLYFQTMIQPETF